VWQWEKIQEMLREMRRTVLALVSAALLALCFASGGLWGLAWVALIPLLIAVDQDTLGFAFLRGYASGFLFFISTLFWIHHVTSLGLILLSAYLALYWAIFSVGVARSSSWHLARRVIFLASLWAGLEYVRAEVLSGFGWSALAHTQSVNILFIQMADITGTYGLSCLMVAVGVVIAVYLRVLLGREKMPAGFRSTAWGVVLVLCVVLVYGAGRLNVPAPLAKTRVALIQANVSLADYWDPLLKPYVVEKHLSLSHEAMKRAPQLIVWPETSFPQFIWDYPGLFEKVRSFAREYKVKILLGAVTKTGEAYFNSAILIDADGQMSQIYNKQHLVLFGEYIPFRKEFPFLAKLVPIDDFTPGDRPVIFRLPQGVTFSSLICFEDTIPFLSRQAAQNGAGFLVNITNDAWFGPSRQSRMHLDNAIFRAVENRMALVRATNTGMSCGVLSTGEVVACVTAADGRQVMVDGFLIMDVPVKGDAGAGALTFYTKYGDVFAMLCFIGILAMSLPIKRNGEA
jgi:apolipoprotein N-acyltransferase